MSNLLETSELAVVKQISYPQVWTTSMERLSSLEGILFCQCALTKCHLWKSFPSHKSSRQKRHLGGKKIRILQFSQQHFSLITIIFQIMVLHHNIEK